MVSKLKSLCCGRKTDKIIPDGSGWIKVRSGHEEGLIPTSYVEMITSSSLHPNRPASSYSTSSVSLSGSMHGGGPTSSGPPPGAKKKGPIVAPKKGAKKLKYVEALYEYEARTDMEHSMKGGEKFVLITKDTGDGWAEVEKGGVVKSVPANYIQEI
jgi:formin-binding protein 1